MALSTTESQGKSQGWRKGEIKNHITQQNAGTLSQKAGFGQNSDKNTSWAQGRLGGSIS